MKKGQTRTTLTIVGEFKRFPREAVPAPLVAPAVLLLLQNPVMSHNIQYYSYYIKYCSYYVKYYLYYVKYYQYYVKYYSYYVKYYSFYVQ
jgi:hypothetical protein